MSGNEQSNCYAYIHIHSYCSNVKSMCLCVRVLMCACVICGSHNGVILSKCLVVTLPGKFWRKVIKVIDVNSDKDLRGSFRFTVVLQQQKMGGMALTARQPPSLFLSCMSV